MVKVQWIELLRLIQDLLKDIMCIQWGGLILCCLSRDNQKYTFRWTVDR